MKDPTTRMARMAVYLPNQIKNEPKRKNLKNETIEC
jgi:hypothetical protein